MRASALAPSLAGLSLLGLSFTALSACSETALRPDPEPTVDPREEEDPSGGTRIDPVPEGIPVGGVQGTICNQPEVGLEGARVLVEHPWGVAQTVTNEEGYFSMEGLPAGKHVLVVTHAEYNTQLVIEVPRNETSTVLDDECVDDCGVPVPCLGLAEAVDRGAVSLMAGPSGTVYIENTSSRFDICLDEWVVMKSLGSQDAIIGQEPSVVLEPGDLHIIDYAVDVFGDMGDEAWWCVEEKQVIAEGVRYTYNGSLAPDILWNYIHDRTDTNYNGTEDHADVNFDNRIQTQTNVWSTQNWHPIVLVGRSRSLARLETPDSSATIRIDASNLGHLPTQTYVYEVVPPGFVVTDTVPEAFVVSEQDGSTTLRWDVTLDGAQPIQDAQAIYDVAKLYYTVMSPEVDPCIGRCEGSGAFATWTDAWGVSQSSASEKLVIEVCPPPAEGEDG